MILNFNKISLCHKIFIKIFAAKISAIYYKYRCYENYDKFLRNFVKSVDGDSKKL